MNDDGFALFLRRIGRTPLLTAAEERALAYRCERGDLAAKDHMIEANLRLVVHVAKRYQRENSPLDAARPGAGGHARSGPGGGEVRPPHRQPLLDLRDDLDPAGDRRAVAEKSREIRVPVSMDQRMRALDKLTAETGARARARGGGAAARVDGGRGARRARRAARGGVARRAGRRQRDRLGALIPAAAGPRTIDDGALARCSSALDARGAAGADVALRARRRRARDPRWRPRCCCGWTAAIRQAPRAARPAQAAAEAGGEGACSSVSAARARGDRPRLSGRGAGCTARRSSMTVPSGSSAATTRTCSKAAARTCSSRLVAPEFVGHDSGGAMMDRTEYIDAVQMLHDGFDAIERDDRGPDRRGRPRDDALVGRRHATPARSRGSRRPAAR